jgi:hypothetical protein
MSDTCSTHWGVRNVHAALFGNPGKTRPLTDGEQGRTIFQRSIEVTGFKSYIDSTGSRWSTLAGSSEQVNETMGSTKVVRQYKYGRVPRDFEPRMTVLARTSSNLPNPSD